MVSDMHIKHVAAKCCWTECFWQFISVRWPKEKCLESQETWTWWPCPIIEAYCLPWWFFRCWLSRSLIRWASRREATSWSLSPAFPGCANRASVRLRATAQSPGTTWWCMSTIWTGPSMSSCTCQTITASLSPGIPAFGSLSVQLRLWSKLTSNTDA